MSLVISTLLKVGAGTLLSIFGRLATQEVLEYLLFKVANVIVKHTDTPHDDEFLAKLEAVNTEAKQKGI